jgi:hypothetical protein
MSSITTERGLAGLADIGALTAIATDSPLIPQIKLQHVALCANIAQTLRKRVCATFAHIGLQNTFRANVVQTLRKHCANTAQT